MDDVEGCVACDLTRRRTHLPGGSIHQTERWVVEHCIGPLGVGTLIVKPTRHIVHVADLNAAELLELGPLLQRTSAIVTELAQPEQVYVCLWSHGPVHIHFVVQPVDAQLMEQYSAHGPKLQVAMFEARQFADEDAVAAFAADARVVRQDLSVADDSGVSVCRRGAKIRMNWRGLSSAICCRKPVDFIA